MKYTYKTQGTCSSHIELEIEDNIITDIAFWGGCNGNLHVISRLEGIRCGGRPTSCPDQLCRALHEMGF